MSETTTDAAWQRLSPQQRDISWGDHWTMPINMGKDFIYFGYVPTKDEVAAEASAARFDPTIAVDTAESLLLRHLLPSRVYSRFNTEGIEEILSRGQVWPIEPTLFEAIETAAFDIRNLGYINQRRFADDAYKPWVQWREVQERTKRRGYAEFVSEVEQLARIATAHNSGQTYYGCHRIGDRRIVMHMSSWPRAQEAITTLERHGFKASHVHEHSVDVMDRSEA